MDMSNGRQVFSRRLICWLPAERTRRCGDVTRENGQISFTYSLAYDMDGHSPRHTVVMPRIRYSGARSLVMEAYSYAVGVASAAEEVQTCGQFWHECRLSDSTQALS